MPVRHSSPGYHVTLAGRGTPHSFTGTAKKTLYALALQGAFAPCRLVCGTQSAGFPTCELFGRLLATLVLATLIPPVLPAQNGGLDPDKLKGIAWRSIGPGFVTGRIADVEIDPKDTNVWYVATAFGGLWKTVNRGISFEPIFDEGPSFNLCCVVIDPKNSNIIWLGTGENHSQRSAHFGDGVYKSTDAGKTWKRVGLETSEHVGKIVIDPREAQAAALGARRGRRRQHRGSSCVSYTSGSVVHGGSGPGRIRRRARRRRTTRA